MNVSHFLFRTNLFAVSWKKVLAWGISIRSVYWCQVCSFSSPHYSPCQRYLFITLDWMDSICCILPCQIKKKEAWQTSFFFLNLFTVETISCQIKRQVHNYIDASACASQWFFFFTVQCEHFRKSPIWRPSQGGFSQVLCSLTNAVE